MPLIQAHYRVFLSDSGGVMGVIEPHRRFHFWLSLAGGLLLTGWSHAGCYSMKTAAPLTCRVVHARPGVHKKKENSPKK